MSTIFQDICQMLHGIESYHDSLTKGHEIRTGKLMGILAEAYGLDKPTCAVMEEIGSIHDIGKIALPESILEKQGPLTVFERRVVELHPQMGYDFIKKINHPHSELAGIIILTHHENYDGTGYPRGLKGNQIPLEGRICAICDCYDALREKRPYREELSHEMVFEMLFDRGSQGMYNKFDPDIASLFKGISDDILNLYIE